MGLAIMPVGCYGVLYSLDRSQTGKVAHAVYSGIRSHENHCIKRRDDGLVRKSALCPDWAQRKQFGCSKTYVLCSTLPSARR